MRLRDAADLAGGFAQSPELVTPPPKRSLGQDQLESTDKRPCKRRLSFKAVAARCSEVFQAQKLVGSGLWHPPFQIGGRYFSCAIRADDESNLMNLAYYDGSGCEEEDENTPSEVVHEEPAEVPSPLEAPKELPVVVPEVQPAEVPPALEAPKELPEVEPVLRAQDQKHLRRQKQNKEGSKTNDSKKKDSKKKKGSKSKGSKTKRSRKEQPEEERNVEEVAAPAEEAVQQEVPDALAEEPAGKRSAQLVSKEQQKELKQLLATLSGVLYVFFPLNGLYVRSTFEFDLCSFHLRLAEPSDSYTHVYYWTRLQLAVKCKSSKRQVWSTPSWMMASMARKILLANAVVPWLCILPSKYSVSTRQIHVFRIWTLKSLKLGRRRKEAIHRS